MVLDSLSLVKNDAQEHHAVQWTPLRSEDFFPPIYLLLGGLALDGRFVLRVRLHDLGICSEDDVVPC
jgi:hypothetical protein